MLRGRVVGKPLYRAKRSLTGHAAFQLLLDFLRAALFERVCATARSEPCDREQDQHAFHLRIL